MSLLKSQVKMDEFALVLLAGVILIGMLMIIWTTPLEPLPTVDPLSVSLSMLNGTSSSFNLNISGRITNVTLSATGAISTWIKFGKNNFDVSEYVIVPVYISVPKTATAGTYKGNIIVRSTGGEKIVSVLVEVSTMKKIASRSISLGDFTVSYTAGTRVLDSKEATFVSKGYFSEKVISLFGLVSDEELPTLTGASIQIIVSETNSLGNLIVIFNGQEVFNERVGIGEVLVPVNVNLIKKSNSIVIKAGNPGFVFWANTVYKFSIVKFTISFKGAFSKEIQFALSESEISNFDHFQLSYRVKDYSVSLPKLTIKINQQTIFREKPDLTIFNRNFEKDMVGYALILSKNNTISFSFEEEAFYDIADVVLTVFYVT